MKKKKLSLEHLCWFATIVFFSLVALSVIGCSLMGIARQKKIAYLMGKQIEFIGEEAMQRCNGGLMRESDCEMMVDSINFALDSQNAYTKALFAMQNGTGSQEQAQKAFEALQDDLSNLVSEAIKLGIKIKERSY